MKQYVDLLEVVCESSPLPTGEVLQDISIIFARLGGCAVITLKHYQCEYGSTAVVTSPDPGALPP